MAGRVITAAGVKVYIGPSESATRAADATAMAALTPYTLISLTESVGDFGDEAQLVTFTALEDSRVRKTKGPKDAGEMTLTVGRTSADPGQQALIAAEATNNAYAFKVVYPDRLSSGGTDSVDYFWGVVRSKRSNVGGATNVLRRAVAVAIDSQIYEVPAA